MNLCMEVNYYYGICPVVGSFIIMSGKKIICNTVFSISSAVCCEFEPHQRLTLLPWARNFSALVESFFTMIWRCVCSFVCMLGMWTYWFVYFRHLVETHNKVVVWMYIEIKILVPKDAANFTENSFFCFCFFLVTVNRSQVWRQIGVKVLLRKMIRFKDVTVCFKSLKLKNRKISLKNRRLYDLRDYKRVGPNNC